MRRQSFQKRSPSLQQWCFKGHVDYLRGSWRRTGQRPLAVPRRPSTGAADSLSEVSIYESIYNVYSRFFSTALAHECSDPER